MSTALTTSSSTIVSQKNQHDNTPILSTPTDRDLEIYKKVKIQRIPQFEVAVDNDLHYSRVSQIVKDVHHWLIAGGQPTDPELKDHAARQRLSRAAHQLRLTRCLELATDYMESRPLQRESTKRRLVHGQEQWREETKRDPLHETRLATIRLVLRTSEALHKLEQTEPKATAPVPAADQDLLPAIFDLFSTWRTRAQEQGRLPAAADVTALVASTLNSLLGTDLQGQESDLRGRESIAQTTSPSPRTATAIDSRPLPLGEPEPSSAADLPPLNFSAETSDPDSINAVVAPTCVVLSSDSAEEKPKLERRATPQHPAPSPDHISLPNPASCPPPSSASLYSTAHPLNLLIPDH
jgi:hypothetical protein